ncbi:MAG: hypothetical protein QXP20_02450 [Candidatus Bathyarchaeia archaeon]
MPCFIKAAIMLGIYIPLQAEDYIENTLLKLLNVPSHDELRERIEYYLKNQPEQLKTLLKKLLIDWEKGQPQPIIY